MLLFVHSITHQMFGLISSMRGCRDEDTCPLPRRAESRGRGDDRLLSPQTPGNKWPSPASALIPRAALVADVVGEGGGGGEDDCRLGDDIFNWQDLCSWHRCSDVRQPGGPPCLAGPFGCCLHSWVFLFLFCLLVTASMCSCVGNPTAPNLVASAPIN